MSRHVEVVFPPPFHNGSRTCTQARPWKIDNVMGHMEVSDKVWNEFVSDVFHAWASSTWGTLCDIMVCLTIVGIPVLICKEKVALARAEKVIEKLSATKLHCAVRFHRISVTEAAGSVRKLVCNFTPLLRAHKSDGNFRPIVVDYDANKDPTAAQGIAGAWHESSRLNRTHNSENSSLNSSLNSSTASTPTSLSSEPMYREDSTKGKNAPSFKVQDEEPVSETKTAPPVTKTQQSQKFVKEDVDNKRNDSFRIQRISQKVVSLEPGPSQRPIQIETVHETYTPTKNHTPGKDPRNSNMRGDSRISPELPR